MNNLSHMNETYDKYDLWMKNRSDKGGGRVIILTKKCVKSGEGNKKWTSLKFYK